MRPTRLLLSTLFVLTTIFLTFASLFYSHPQRRTTASSSATRESGFRALFSFHAPSSLFPPSAIISLTDDNSTFFLARPAQFGPPLPSDGLSGQLWVGSGFGDDNLVHGDAFVKAEGELGCTDIPGWSKGREMFAPEQIDGASSIAKDGIAKPQSRTGSRDLPRRSETGSKPDSSKSKSTRIIPREDDGTDDHLHYPLQGVTLAKGRRSGKEQSPTKMDHITEHADIQSLQESAEIAGKVVLLSRGGCGFLEKVKWAQRRGGVAVIVGDNVRGGQLVSMYARGDTSNVTIPSLFTSQTTAHLLSSLIPPDGSKDGSTLKSNEKVEDMTNKAAIKKQKVDGTTFTPIVTQPKVTGIPRSNRLPISKEHSPSRAPNLGKGDTVKSGWLRKLASGLGLRNRVDKPGPSTDSRRPPSSGRIKWMVSDDWDDEPVAAKLSKAGQIESPQDSTSSKSQSNTIKASQQESGDDFMIGVQDWRDPDLVGSKGQDPRNDVAAAKKQDLGPKASTASGQKSEQMKEGLSGGSRAPASGVYGSPGPKHKLEDQKDTPDNAQKKNAAEHSTSDGQWRFTSLFGASKPDDDSTIANEKAKDLYTKKIASHFIEDHDFKDGDFDAPVDHEGLWVTMTPTRMSTTPFFDTLLVLVVSPLVTLTVVYALLLVRSRIRRRRWRAPKSVVERLPVRTYHTMSCSSSSTSSQTSSPGSSSPTSPLLPSGIKSVLTRPRPRSRTMSNIRQDASKSLDRATERITFPSFPRKKYSGRQVECVVCLEEYVDGQSRVMSLPCGHEFHADCMQVVPTFPQFHANPALALPG